MISPTYERWSSDHSRDTRSDAVRALGANGLQAFLSEHQDDAVMVLDRSGTIVEINAALVRRTGYAATEVIGSTLADVVEPRFHARVQALVNDALHGHSARTEAVGVKRDGGLCDLSITVVPLADEHRDVVGVLSITQNLSEVTSAYEDRARNDQLLALAGRVAGFSGWSLDLRTEEITWSQVHGRATHPRPSTVSELLSMVDPSDAARLERSLARVGREGRLLSTTVTLNGRGSEPRVVRLVAEQVLDRAGAVVAVHGAAHDITEQVQRDETLRRIDRMESLGSFASGIAHDLNNVLTPILMAAQLMRLSAPDDGQRETLEMIEAAARRGTDMVRQVLSFSTGVVGKRDDVDVAQLLIELETLFADSLPPRITLQIESIDDDLHIRGDSTQLLQVLTNLCANARDAIEGEGIISVHARRERKTDGILGASDEGTLVIEVIDTGSGMSADTLERLFEPFFTTKVAGSGTGLGLSMSAAIVRSHGGTITAHSDGHSGTTMVVRLPVDDRLALSASAVSAERHREHAPLSNPSTVLVVDDESAIRTLTRRALELDGYDVIEAEDGQQAIDGLTRGDAEVSAIITDVTMPRIDGLELFDWVATHLPHVPVVLMSGRGARSGDSREHATPVHAYLDKPFTLESLRERMREARARAGVAR